MSEPNRYHLWAALECHAFSKAEAVLRFSAEEDGMWVQWQDYAYLKAEVERLNLLTVEMDKTINISQAGCRQLKAELTNCKAESDQLQAEVERLDAERSKALSDFWYIQEGYFRLEAELNRLRAANEGKSV